MFRQCKSLEHARALGKRVARVGCAAHNSWMRAAKSCASGVRRSIVYRRRLVRDDVYALALAPAASSRIDMRVKTPRHETLRIIEIVAR